MDDKKHNPLRLLVLAGIVLYFIFLAATPQNETLVEAQPTTALPSQPAQPQPAPATKPTINCKAQIEQVGLSTSELRLRITGAANQIIVYTDQGNLTATTTEAGSAGEYRIRTPGPATAVQLDDCPVLNLR